MDTNDISSASSSYSTSYLFTYFMVLGLKNTVPHMCYTGILTPQPGIICFWDMVSSPKWFYLLMLRMTPKSWLSNLCFLCAGITGMCHHIWLLAIKGLYINCPLITVDQTKRLSLCRQVLLPRSFSPRWTSTLKTQPSQTREAGCLFPVPSQAKQMAWIYFLSKHTDGGCRRGDWSSWDNKWTVWCWQVIGGQSPQCLSLELINLG